MPEAGGRSVALVAAAGRRLGGASQALSPSGSRRRSGRRRYPPVMLVVEHERRSGSAPNLVHSSWPKPGPGGQKIALAAAPTIAQNIGGGRRGSRPRSADGTEGSLDARLRSERISVRSVGMSAIAPEETAQFQGRTMGTAAPQPRCDAPCKRAAQSDPLTSAPSPTTTPTTGA